MPMDIRGTVRPRADGRWAGESPDAPVVRVEAGSREECVAALRHELLLRGNVEGAIDGEGLAVIIEVVPVVAGVAEAAQVMGWDKRRVITYIDRGRFPEPVQTLASGRIWLREDVERFALEWHARRRARGGSRAHDRGGLGQSDRRGAE
jgi:hypothetical protein